MIRSDLLRRVMLLLIAGVFLAIAVGSVMVPDTMARGLGYQLDNADARNEFRAIYVGLWLAHAVLFVIAAKRIREPILGDLAALLLVGQVAGRLLSVALDGQLPSASLAPPFIAETVGGLALFAVRPTRRLR